jgi:hypothetical protein
MATFVLAMQGSKETRTHYISFANDLPSGVSVSSVALTHTGPSVETPTSAVSSPNVNVTLATPAPGLHYIRCLATLSDAQTAEAFLIVKVSA